MKISIFILYVCSFVFIYNVPFTGSPLSGSKLMIIFMAAWLFIRSRKIVFTKKLIKIVAWMIVLLFYSLANVFLQRTGDFALVYAEILFILNHILGCVLLVNLLQTMGKSQVKDILHMLVVISFVQSIIIILSMLISPFNTFISRIAFIEGRDNLQLRYGFARGYGLAASVTYDLAVCQAFAIIFIPYLIQKTKNSRMKMFYILSSFPILFSILTLGRTGLIGVGLALIYIFRESIKMRSKLIKNLLYVIGLFMIISIVFLINTDSALISSMKTYVFEGFDTLFTTGKFQTHTWTNLMNMWNKIYDFSLKTWIVGDARYTDGARYYMRTDIGVMRDILYFGIIGCVLLVVEYLVIYKTIKNNAPDRQFVFMIQLIFIFLMVAHFKGEFLLACGTGICMVLVIALVQYPIKNREGYGKN